MRTRAVRAAVGLMMASAVVCAGPVHAQVKAGADQGLGLTGSDIPPLLKDVEADPYRLPAGQVCKSIPDEIAALNAVLGADVDAGLQVKTSGGDVVRGLVPYGGVFRTLTGAGKKDKLLARAVLAGVARRGFLRGLQANLNCTAPPVS